MEVAIKKALNTSVLKATGIAGAGCISAGEVYTTDNGKIFIKKNNKDKAQEMFDGEYESLLALHSTGRVRVPKPLCVVDNPDGGAALVMEYIEFKGLTRKANILGDQMARLHLHNIEMENKLNKSEQYVGSAECNSFVPKFGFNVPTSCGYLLQQNTWCEDWPTFYTQKLQYQIDLIVKEYGDREVLSLWSNLSRKIPDFFKDLVIKPSLLHGDLWCGNVGETQSEPVIFDPASFYGHHEYDLAIACMFGGFSRSFWDSYHKVIPKTEGWDKRNKLYVLFHNLNHWNHFGCGYKSGSLQIMKSLTK